MPPRYAYWTILVDDKPTAFRAGSQEDLLPTFKRLQATNPTAKMMWFQNGKLWTSRLEAQEWMRFRGENSRKVLRAQSESKGIGDARPRGFRSRERLEWTPRPSQRQARKPASPRKLEWKPRGEAPASSAGPQARKPTSPRRDKNWRPGGEHKDPRQKYKDAKKARWTRFKQNVRARWESKQQKKKGGGE